MLAGFWPQPIQWAGVLIGIVSCLLALVAVVWASVIWAGGAISPGLLYLASLVLGVLGIQGFMLALVGEYLGRIQREVEGRPLYAIERELEASPGSVRRRASRRPRRGRRRSRAAALLVTRA